MVRTFVAVVAVVQLAAGSAVAQPARTGANVPPSTAGMALSEIEAVRRDLFARMMADPGNLDVAFEYARLSSQAGDLEGAISTLERMLVFAPGLTPLQVELGVLYFRLGAYETASGYLEAAMAAPDAPPDMRERVERYLAAIETRTGVNSFEGSVFVGARYQTNANAAPESSIVNLNGFDVPLDEDATASADVNAFATGNFRFTHDLQRQGDRIEVGLHTYGALYADRDELNIGIAELTAGPVFNLARFHLRDAELGVYGILGGVVLESDPYLGTAGVGASLTKGLSPGTRLVARGEYRRERFEDSEERPTASLRTGDRYRASISLHHRVSQHIRLFGRLAGAARNAEVDYLGLRETGGSLGGRVDFASPIPALDGRWILALEGGLLRRAFDAPDPVVNPTRSARDSELFVEATLSVPLADDWSMHASAGYRDVDSTYDTRSFDNFITTLGVMRRF